jgi:hypothetical protein
MSISATQASTTFKKYIAGFTVAMALVMASLVGTASAASVSFDSARDCDDNAILRCGAMDVAELQRKYNADTKAQTVYNWYNISDKTIANLGSTAVAGKVHKDGTVTVGNKVVAKNAVSAGYHKMAGSTAVTRNGVTFYNTAPETSFVANSIDAFVILNNKDQFVSAILAACGNPVKATNTVPAPVEQPKPTPQPTPTPTPQPTPTPVAPAAAVTPAKELVVTGPGSVATVAALFTTVTVMAAAGHAWFMRRKQAF